MKSVFLAITGILVAISGAVADPVSWLRFDHEGNSHHGRLENGMITVLDGSPLDGAAETGQILPLDSVTLLPPVIPQKVFAIGLNFRSHAGNAGAARPEVFLKLPTSVGNPGAAIQLTEDMRSLHFEGELVLVIGKEGKNIPEDKAMDHVFALSAGNDLTERRWQNSDLQWFRGKAADGFGPIGPVMVSGLDWRDLVVETRLNGTIVQQESTANMIHNPAQIIAFISRYATLTPGDVIFTGTPGRTQALEKGDLVEVEIKGIGVLETPIR